MTESVSERALSAVKTKLQGILVASGYRTNAGASVFRSTKSIQTTDLPALVLWDLGETAADADGNSRSMSIALSIGIDAHIAADQADTGLMLEQIKADVKKAVLSFANPALRDSDGTIGPIRYTGCKIGPRAEGDSTEWVSLDFVVTYKEGYGDPYTNKA